MKNLIKKTALILLASVAVSVAPVMAEEVSSFQLEKALMKYVLTYEAYQKAKQSPNKEIRANLPKYVRLYREAYAQYLELLRKAELYDPADESMENDPAGNYNKKRPDKQQVKWSAVKSGTQRAQVKQVVENGGDPDDVFVIVKKNLPSKPIGKTKQQIEDEAKAAAEAAAKESSSSSTEPGPGIELGSNTGNQTTTPKALGVANQVAEGVESGKSKTLDTISNLPDTQGSKDGIQ